MGIYQAVLYMSALKTHITSFTQNNLPGIILLVDFEKAFDSISFEFIMTTLELFYFLDSFKEMD